MKKKIKSFAIFLKKNNNKHNKIKNKKQRC
jgi:hypothetical protein